MYYRIKFKSCPDIEYIFGDLMHVEKEKIRVWLAIQKAKRYFQLYHSKLILFCEDNPREELDEMDYITNGKTYIINRLPLVGSKRKLINHD